MPEEGSKLEAADGQHVLFILQGQWKTVRSDLGLTAEEAIRRTGVALTGSTLRRLENGGRAANQTKKLIIEYGQALYRLRQELLAEREREAQNNVYSEMAERQTAAANALIAGVNAYLMGPVKEAPPAEQTHIAKVLGNVRRELGMAIDQLEGLAASTRQAQK